MKAMLRFRSLKLLAAGGSLLLFSGCPLTDQDMTAIVQSAMSTAFNAGITQWIESLAAAV